MITAGLNFYHGAPCGAATALVDGASSSRSGSGRSE